MPKAKRKSKGHPRRRLIWLGIGLAIVMVAIFSGLLWRVLHRDVGHINLANQQFAIHSNRDGAMDIFLMRYNRHGTEYDLMNLTVDMEGEAMFPVWSPDGLWIAFDHGSERNNYTNISDDNAVYIMRFDGTDKQRIGKGFSPSWSPDGRTLFYSEQYYQANASGIRHWQSTILSYDISTSETALVLDIESCECGNTTTKNQTFILGNYQLEPNGNRALFQAQGKIYMRYLNTGEIAYVGYGIDPVWSSQGRFAVGDNSGHLEDGYNGIAIRDGSPFWSPDGQYLAYDFQNPPGVWSIGVRDIRGNPGQRLISYNRTLSYGHPSWRPR